MDHIGRVPKQLSFNILTAVCIDFYHISFLINDIHIYTFTYYCMMEIELKDELV